MSLVASDCAGGGPPNVDKVKKNVKQNRSNIVSDAPDFHDVKVVVNEVLTYVSFHVEQCTVESIRVAVLNFYDPGSINEAKRILWDSCAQYLPPYEARRSSPVDGSVHDKEVNDMLLAIKGNDKKDGTVMPTFVAQHLDKLPRVTPGELEVVSLLERISILDKAMSSVQQCVTRHDSVLSAATNDNSAAAPARRREKVTPAQMSRPTESSLTAPGIHAPVTSHLDDGHLWSDTNRTSTVATDPPADGFQIPRYHRKKAAAVKAAPQKATEQTKNRRQVYVYYVKKKSDTFNSAPRKQELLVFNVEKETDMTALKDFMQEEHVKVIEMECVSLIDLWTKSFRVLVTADDPKCTLDLTSGLLVSGVGCILKSVEKLKPKLKWH